MQRKVYTLEDKFPLTSSTCTRPDLFSSLPITVLRDITLPLTETGQQRKKFTFTYNSEAADTYSQTWQPGCGANTVQTSAPTHGWAELSQMIMPSGATVNYTYDLDGVHRLFETGIENNDLPRAGISRKDVTHDGITDTWTYGHGSVQGGMTGPDGSSTVEHTYTTDPAFSALYGGPGLGSLSYKTERFLNGVVNVTTERHWTRFKFDEGSDLQPGTANVAPFNAVVDAEYTTLHNSSGVATKMNAKSWAHDYNGNVTAVTEYDWFDPGLVVREGGTVNLPVSPPASATKLRVTNSSYHSQADGLASTNVYAKRISGGINSPPSPLILNAVKQTTAGSAGTVLSTTRFHYDGHNGSGGFDTLPTAGNVTKARRDNSGVWIDTFHTYDGYGNRLTTTDPRGNITTFVYGDATHAQPTSITVDPDNQIPNNELTTLIAYDYYTGLVETQTDPNGNQTTTDYTNQSLNAVDPFGRPGKVTGPYVSVNINGQVSTQRRTAVTKYFDNALQVETISDLNAENDGKLRNRTSADQLARAIKTEHSEDGSTYSISSETVYKNKPGGLNGSVVFTRNPDRSGSDPTDGWTRTTQDAMGRTTEVAIFAGAAQPPETGTTGTGVTWTGSVNTSYNVEQTTVTDQASKQRRSIVDGLGRLVAVVEDPGDTSQGKLNFETDYTYDALGNLIQVDQGTQHRYFTYDSLSRLKTAKNPEQVSGSTQTTTTYDYDDASNLLSKTGPNSGSSVSFTYDGLNRVKTKTLSSGGTWDYTYDTTTITNAKGRLVSVALHGGTDGYYYDGYDAMGRVTASRQMTTAGTANSYTMSYGYDLAGNLTSQTYPSGKEYRTSYDNAGRVNGVSRYISNALDKTYASSFSYTPHGAASAMTLGNNLIDKTTFNSRLQPTQIKLGTSASPSSVLQLDYTYGVLVGGTLDTTKNNGNIQSQVISAPKTAGGNLVLTQNYTYDPLNRLSIAEELITTTSQWKQTYDIDRWGNRAVRNTSYIPSASLTPWSANSADFSAFDQETNRIKPSVMPGFGYDTSGNLTSDPNTPTSGIVYDAENHQTSYTKSGVGTTSYSYDGDGHRVKRTDTDNATTIFVYNVLGQLVAEYTSGTPQGSGTSYLTSDHLGSTRVVTGAADGSGNVTLKARYDYLPFGEEVGSDRGSRSSVTGYVTSDTTRQKFTQKERDSESGLDYFLARYYSSAQGRFTSPDEFAGGPDEFWAPGSGDSEKQALAYADITNPQSLNKYQYGFGNPLRYIDLDGHQSQDKNEGILTTLFRLLGLLQPSPMPDPGKQGILNQRIPGQDGMTFGDNLKGQLEATKLAAENLQKINELIDPTGGAAGAYVGKQAGLRSNSDVAIAAAAGVLNFASPAKALGHFEKHVGEFGGTLKSAVQYVLGARAHIGSATSDVVRYQNAAGRVLVYNQKTNEFATNTGKTIHTYFKPKEGTVYVDKIVKTQGYKRIK